MADEPNKIILPHGGYQKLKSFQMSEIVYDATVVFCSRFINKYSRTIDQMVQAARNGRENVCSKPAFTKDKSNYYFTLFSSFIFHIPLYSPD